MYANFQTDLSETILIHVSFGLRPQRKNFPGVQKSLPGPQILLDPQTLLGAYAVKSFFVRRV